MKSETLEQRRARKPESQWRYVALLGSELDYLSEALNFFKVPFEINPSHMQRYELAILYREYAPALKEQGLPFLCVPSNTEKFYHFLDKMNVQCKCVDEEIRVCLRIRKKARISFNISRLFYFNGAVDIVVSFKGIPLLYRVRETEIHLLSVDLADEIRSLFSLSMDLKPTFFFRFYTRFRLASLVPRRLGHVLLKLFTRVDISLEEFQTHINSLDGLRHLLLAASVVSTQKSFRTIGFWKNGAKYAFTITHDVDTKYGFEAGISRLRDVERKYGVKSAWNIPAGHYPLNPKILKALISDGCEIGSHGFRHDGRLIFHEENELVKIFHTCKAMLERLADCEVKGFRSPLLQHSCRILRAAARARFLYDSSLPAWEVHCRTSGTPHGIRSVYPLIENGIVILTVTMPQDHQLLQLAGLKPEVAFALWKALITHIKSIGGFCNLIVHPDKGLFGNESLLSYYDEIIRNISSDKECWLALPSEVAEHWILRSGLKIEGMGKMFSSEGVVAHWDWVNQMFGVVAYRPDDFTFR